MSTLRHDKPQSGQPAIGDTPASAVNINQWRDEDWRTDLRRCLARYGMVRSRDTGKSTGQKTVTNRRNALERTISLLTARNRGIRSLSQVKPRHLAEIVQCWIDAGIAETTQVQYFSCLRWFWKLHGIKVGTIKSYVENPEAYVIRSAAQFDRSVSHQVDDAQQVFDQLGRLDQRMRLFAQLARSAGLRRLECLCLDPHNDDLGLQLKVVHGSKGGRQRVVDLTEGGRPAYELARATLEELKQITPLGERAGWPGLTLKQAERRFEYFAAKAGITKRTLGATFHGFRHDYAINTLETLTGQTAPIRGGQVVDYPALRAHQQRVSQQLGHNRAKVTNAYYGSFAAMKKRAQNNFVRSWQMLEPQLEDVLELLRTHGANNLYLVGARAMGADQSAMEPFYLQLQAGLDDAVAATLSRTLSVKMRRTMGVPVSIAPDLCVDEAARAELMKRAFPLFAPEPAPKTGAGPTPKADTDQAVDTKEGAVKINTEVRVAGPRPQEHGWRKTSASGGERTYEQSVAGLAGCTGCPESRFGARIAAVLREATLVGVTEEDLTASAREELQAREFRVLVSDGTPGAGIRLEPNALLVDGRVAVLTFVSGSIDRMRARAQAAADCKSVRAVVCIGPSSWVSRLDGCVAGKPVLGVQRIQKLRPTPVRANGQAWSELGLGHSHAPAQPTVVGHDQGARRSDGQRAAEPPSSQRRRATDGIVSPACAEESVHAILCDPATMRRFTPQRRASDRPLVDATIQTIGQAQPVATVTNINSTAIEKAFDHVPLSYSANLPNATSRTRSLGDALQQRSNAENDGELERRSLHELLRTRSPGVRAVGTDQP